VKVTGKFTLVTPLLAGFLGGQTINISASAVAQLGVEPQPAPGTTPTPSPSPSPTPAPTPDPTPTPTLAPGETPTPTPSPSPSPTPTPVCETPKVSGSLSASPTSGSATNGVNTGTLFTFSAPMVHPQPGCPFAYSWSFGDGASGVGETVTHTYGTKGPGSAKQFTVTLAISTFGVPLTWTGTVHVVVN
jgi:hypothetical protein